MINQAAIDAYCDAIEALGESSLSVVELCEIVAPGLKPSAARHVRFMDRLVSKVEYAMKKRKEAK